MSIEPEVQYRSKRLGRIVNNGYRYIYKPSHPRAKTHGGYVGEHVLVMEQALGRLLLDDELVHHKDENRLNNNPDNLEVTSRSRHAQIHAKPPAVVELTCRNCGKAFVRKRRQVVTKIKNGQVDFYCERRCAAASFGHGRSKQ